MAETVSGGSFGHGGPAAGVADFARDRAFMEVVPAPPTGARVNRDCRRGENPLPAPVGGGRGCLALERCGQAHLPPPACQLLLMEWPNAGQGVCNAGVSDTGSTSRRVRYRKSKALKAWFWVEHASSGRQPSAVLSPRYRISLQFLLESFRGICYIDDCTVSVAMQGEFGWPSRTHRTNREIAN